MMLAVDIALRVQHRDVVREAFTGRFVAEIPRAIRRPNMVLASLSVTLV
jgi:hypothetical protein